MSILIIAIAFLLLGWIVFQPEVAKQINEPIVELVTSEPIKTAIEKKDPIKKSNKSINENPIQQVNTYAGSNPDGAINLDELGNIVIDIDLKHLFDYFLTATGEISFQEIRNHIIVYAQTELNQIQLNELLGLLSRYRNYLKSAEDFTNNLSLDLTQQEILELLSDFRIKSLGEEMAKQFFTKEEDYVNFVFANKDGNIENISEQQAAWLEAENQATSFQDTVIENREFKQSNALSTDDIHKKRVQQYGEQATQRLEQLDQQRDQWQETVDEYISQRQQIENNQSQSTLEQLHSNYPENDVRRLQALWRINN